MLNDAAFRVYQALPGATRVSLLDDATDEVHALSPRPCGVVGCPADCQACADAVWDRVTAAMREMVRAQKEAQKTGQAPAPPPPLEEATTEYDLDADQRMAEVPAAVAERLRARRTGCQ